MPWPFTRYRPRLLEPDDFPALVPEAARFLGVERTAAERLHAAYLAIHVRAGYAETLGEEKTLCFEEAFLLYMVMAVRRPAGIVEIGTQHGKSTRRILDAHRALGLPGRVHGFDIEDTVRHFDRGEADFHLEDLTTRYRERVLEGLRPGLVYLDAHPRPLLETVIRETLAAMAPPVLAIHDCGRGLCNPRMRLLRDDPRVTSKTGVWERWVLAEAFGLADPLDPALDELDLPAHRFRIFPTRHGLGLLLPKPSDATPSSV